jgi:hypothetical protein
MVAIDRSNIMKSVEDNVPTLKEALQRSCKHRDMELALQPMDNHSKTPGGPNETLLAF